MSDKIDDNNSTCVGILFIILGFILVILCAAGIWRCQLFFFDDIYLNIDIDEKNTYIWLPPTLNVISYIFTTIIIFFFYKTILSYISKIKNICGNSLLKWQENLYLTKTIDRIIKAYPSKEAEAVLNELNDAYNDKNYFLIKKIMINLSKKEDENIPINRVFKFFKKNKKQ